MNYRPKITQEVRDVLNASGRVPGWNTKAPTVRRFEIGYEPGRCVLFVPTYSVWAYNRRRKQAAEYASQRQG
jgi:hypothetical protein